MGFITKKLILFSIAISLVGCSIFEKGYDNQYGQYVPKKPRFKFKDKEGFLIPSNLDTDNVYHMAGKDDIAFNNIQKPYTNSEYENIHFFMKFYPNGRCLTFTKLIDESISPSKALTTADFTPNTNQYSRCYYFPENDSTIIMEKFVYGLGYGRYIYLKYRIDSRGESLRLINEVAVKVYNRMIIDIDTADSPDW